MRVTSTTKSWPAAAIAAAAIAVTALAGHVTADQATRPGTAVNIVAAPGATMEPGVAARVGDTLGGQLRVIGQQGIAGGSSTVTIRGRVFFNDRRNHGLFSTRRELDGDEGTKCGTDGLFNDGTSCSLHWLAGYYMVVDVFERDTGYFAPSAWDCTQSDKLASAAVGYNGSFSVTFTPTDECDSDDWVNPRIALQVRLRFNGDDYSFSMNHDDGLSSSPYALYYPDATHDAPLMVTAGNTYELVDMAFNPAGTSQSVANDTSIAANYYATLVDSVLTLHRDSGIPFYNDEFGELKYIYPSTETSSATTKTHSKVVIADTNSWVGGDVVAHEFGHVTNLRAWDGDYGWPGVGLSWSVNEALESRHAFKEGWANFVSRAVLDETMGCGLASFDDNSSKPLPGALFQGSYWVTNVNKLLCDWLDERVDNDASIAGAGDHWSAEDLYSVWHNLRRMYLDDNLYGGDYQDGLDVCDYVHYYLDVRKSAAAVGGALHDAYVEDITDLVYNNNIACFLPVPALTRAVRREWEEAVQGPTDRASERLADARFGVYGETIYPDATSTLRLTYGQVEGSNVPGQRFTPFTTFAGLWDRATGASPFDLAPKILAARARIDPTAVIDMTLSTDTIGGSSGSPVINSAAEIIGANFDSTVLTQRNAYGYDRDVNRSIAVTTGAVTTALRDVYGMDRLLAELGVR